MWDFLISEDERFSNDDSIVGRWGVSVVSVQDGHVAIALFQWVGVRSKRRVRRNVIIKDNCPIMVVLPFTTSRIIACPEPNIWVILESLYSFRKTLINTHPILWVWIAVVVGNVDCIAADTSVERRCALGWSGAQRRNYRWT